MTMRDRSEGAEAVSGGARAGGQPQLCTHLRTKGMYLPPNPRADGAAPEGSATAVYWCLKTMKVTGPDGQPVDREDCVPPRACFAAGDA